uniref:ATP-dependent nuclease n=1 Tax=Dialister sp. TaxID=1955814 RepID=UPI0040289297
TSSRGISCEHMLTTYAKGRSFLSLLVSVDEPELHLHPYLQRAMLSFCHMILSNEEPFFLKLVQPLLGVDGLSGQLFVVTHSTDALVNDYRQIIRLYWDEKKLVQAACGASFHFDREIEKHLIMHFPEVKEALYARAAVLVEGETEYGSFAGFAKTLGIRFDHYGICLINARGESSISKIASLIRRFHVPVVSLYDRDVMGEHKKSAGVFYTDYICYEMDVVKACLSRNGRRLLDAVIADITEGGNLVSSALVKKAGAKLAIPKGYYPPRKLSNINPRDEKALEFYYFAWLYGNKGVIIGRSLADHLGKDFIPPAFVKVILAAVGVSEK